jgi:hypothetical protein
VECLLGSPAAPSHGLRRHEHRGCPRSGTTPASLFIDRLEQEQDAGNSRYVEANLPQLRKRIAKFQGEAYEMARRQERARTVLLRHG